MKWSFTCSAYVRVEIDHVQIEKYIKTNHIASAYDIILTHTHNKVNLDLIDNSLANKSVPYKKVGEKKNMFYGVNT